MKIIDLDLFKFEPIEIEGDNKKYQIKMIPAAAELELIQSQEEINKKMSSMKNLTKDDIAKYKSMIGMILRENNSEYDESFHDKLTIMSTMGLLIALVKLVNGRNGALFQIFDVSEQEAIKKKMETMTTV